MADFQAAKAVVRDHYAAIAKGTPDTIAKVLSERTTPDWYFRGMHPFNEQHGARAVADAFWIPFMTAIKPVQRRQDIFLAGLNEMDNFRSTWVVSMGHLMGLFDKPFLGIRPNGRICMMRYVEFNRVVDGRICETALFCDVIQIMIQAGQYPMPPQTGAHLVQPGPMTHDGLMYDAQDPAVGRSTLARIDNMLSNMSGKKLDWVEVMRQDWHDDMIWWGPSSIGATYTIPRYREQHAGPFNTALNHGYRFNGHLCRLAEGSFGGFFGWPNLTLSNSGGYLGMTAGSNPADMRVVDMYRIHDDRIAENWCSSTFCII